MRATKARTLSTLRDLVTGIEAAGYEEDWDAIPEAIYDAYCAARAILGSPVVAFPGGPEGEHFHFLRAEGEECDFCNEVAEGEAVPVRPCDLSMSVAGCPRCKEPPRLVRERKR